VSDELTGCPVKYNPHPKTVLFDVRSKRFHPATGLGAVERPAGRNVQHDLGIPNQSLVRFHIARLEVPQKESVGFENGHNDDGLT
jgi:hypothetical protein